jgi:hypothetical protein
MGRRSREKASRRRVETPSAPPRAARPAAPSRPEGPPLPIAPDTVALTPWPEVWRADGAAFVTIFLVAFAFRLAVLVQTASTPYLEVANIDSGS